MALRVMLKESTEGSGASSPVMKTWLWPPEEKPPLPEEPEPPPQADSVTAISVSSVKIHANFFISLSCILGLA
jgi:hypothetical protein